MELTVKFAPLEHQETVAKLSGKHVAFNLEAMNTDLFTAPLCRDKVFEESKVFLETVVFVFEGFHLRGELGLCSLLDLQARLTRVSDLA